MNASSSNGHEAVVIGAGQPALVAGYHLALLVYGPMAHGLLTGRMTEDTTFGSGDWRAGSDLFRGETYRRNLRIVRELEVFAAERGTSVAQLAIAWTLANPAVHVAIVGGRAPEQIIATAPARRCD